MKLQAMIGCKLFKVQEDNSVNIIRIMNVKKYKDGGIPSEIHIRDEETKEIKKVRVDSLSDYTPLEADGLITFSVVNINTPSGKKYKDVVITTSKILDIKIGRVLPFAVCRQNIVDVFYNLLVKTEEDMIVGLAINQNNCPANYDYGLMLACDSIDYSECINFYRNDTLEDIYEFIKLLKFDTVLFDLYSTHVQHESDPSIMMRKEHKGWCKDLKTLLKENSFQSDINEMLGIADVTFDMKNYIIKTKLPNDIDIESVTDDLKAWFSSIYKININDLSIIKYDHDINLAEFNNVKYFMIRDNCKDLYLLVYTENGEYHEKDLEVAADKKDFSTEFKLKFYNKYNHSK